MRILTTKLNSYSLQQLIVNAPKLEGVVFSMMQSADKKGNPTEYWEAVYFSEMNGTIKYRKQAKSPKKAIIELYKEVRSNKKK